MTAIKIPDGEGNYITLKTPRGLQGPTGLTGLIALTYDAIYSTDTILNIDNYIEGSVSSFNRSPQNNEYFCIVIKGISELNKRSWMATCMIISIESETSFVSIITDIVETTGEKGDNGEGLIEFDVLPEPSSEYTNNIYKVANKLYICQLSSNTPKRYIEVGDNLYNKTIYCGFPFNFYSQLEGEGGIFIDTDNGYYSFNERSVIVEYEPETVYHWCSEVYGTSSNESIYSWDTQTETLRYNYDEITSNKGVVTSIDVDNPAYQYMQIQSEDALYEWKEYGGSRQYEISEDNIIDISNANTGLISGRRAEYLLQNRIKTINNTSLIGTGDITLASLLYPIGSIYITSTNESPASYLGGTWELFDKEFISTQSASGGFDRNTTNVTSSTVYWSRSGHAINCELSVTNKVALTDTAIVLGTFDIDLFGISRFNHTDRTTGYSDGGNGVVEIATSTAGTVTSVDVIGKTSSAQIAVGETIFMSFTQTIHFENMLDEACDKFYWKRIS